MIVNGYYVPDADVNAMLTAWDVWRDGKGRFTGSSRAAKDMLRELFLRTTSDIASRVFFGARREHDPFGPTRYTRVLRALLAKRQRDSLSPVPAPSGPQQLTLWEE